MLLADPAAIQTPAATAWSPAYPTADFLGAAAGYVAAMSDRRSLIGGAPEGPTWYLQLTPGGVRVGTIDLAKANRSAEREVLRHEFDIAHCEEIALIDRPSTREVTRWSTKSRARMAWRFASLDYSVWRDRPPAMVTLTMPGIWEWHAPSGKAFKRLVDRFWKRYRRAWGHLPAMLWKLELQRRGAPHLHVLMQTPQGTVKVDGEELEWGAWFARTWADVLGVEGRDRDRVIFVHSRRQAYGDAREGIRASDPRRVAVYFLKHGSFRAKEYQHNVPDLWSLPGNGPGRFWGWRGFKVRSKTVYLGAREAELLARTVRRHYRSGLAKQGGARRRLRSRFAGTRGYLIVNDAAGLALALGEVITLAGGRRGAPQGIRRTTGEGDPSGFRRWSMRVSEDTPAPHRCGLYCEVRHGRSTGAPSSW